MDSREVLRLCLLRNNVTWAAKLIPTSERGAGAFVRPVDGSQGESALGSQGSRVGNEDSALKGISFAAMSAAGPSYGDGNIHFQFVFSCIALSLSIPHRMRVCQ